MKPIDQIAREFTKNLYDRFGIGGGGQHAAIGMMFEDFIRARDAEWQVNKLRRERADFEIENIRLKVLIGETESAKPEIPYSLNDLRRMMDE